MKTSQIRRAKSFIQSSQWHGSQPPSLVFWQKHRQSGKAVWWKKEGFWYGLIEAFGKGKL